MEDVDISGEARSWVGENWDPDLTVGEWWQRLADAPRAQPAELPAYGDGKDATRDVLSREV